MALTAHPSNDNVITPEELVEWCAQNVDPLDEQSVLGAAEMLFSLHNNRTFLADFLYSELRLSASEGAKQQSPQSILFAREGPFRVRMNIWSPAEAQTARSQRHQDQVFSYITPHDHNFGLLTIGYQGGGYTTVIHEYDRDAVEGYPGESVTLDYLETTTLSKGKVLYYRPSRDVHAQLYPKDVSISLNLVVEHLELRKHAQFEFDPPNNRIVGLLKGTGTLRQTAILNFMFLLDCVDDNVIDVVHFLATNHESKYVRLGAYNVLARHRPKELESLAVRATDETSALVREQVRRIVAGEPPVLAPLTLD